MSKPTIPMFYWVAVSKVNNTYRSSYVASNDTRDVSPSNVAAVLAGRRAYRDSLEVQPPKYAKRDVSYALSVLYVVDTKDLLMVENNGPCLFIDGEPQEPIDVDNVNFRDITKY